MGSHGRVENILQNEFGVSKVSARWVAPLLTPEQKLTRLILSQVNLTIFDVFSLRMSVGSITLTQRAKDNHCQFFGVQRTSCS